MLNDFTRSDRPDHPYDLTILGERLFEPDSVSPQDLYHAICDIGPVSAPDLGYMKLPRYNVQLSTLRSAYTTGNSRKAISLLGRRCLFQIDDEYIVDVDDPKYCFTAKNSFLDFFMIVGKSIGLSVFIPQSPSPTFTLTLNLKVPIREFRAKYGTLGFDPTGCMLWIGTGYAEDLWLAMAPDAYFDNDSAKFEMSEAYGDTRLSTAHYRMVVSFISHALTKIPGRAFYDFEPYAVDIEAAEPNFHLHLNAM